MKLFQKSLIVAVALLAVLAVSARAAVTTNALGQVVTTTDGVTTVSDPNIPAAAINAVIPLSGSAQVDTNATTTTSSYTPRQPLDFLQGKVGSTNALWVSVDGTGWVKIAQE